MPICPHCSQEVVEDTQYCTHCGREMAVPPPEPPPAAVAPPAPERELRLGEYLKTGWGLFKQYPQGFVGFALLSVVVMFVMKYVPVAGTLATLVVQYPLIAGYLVVSARLIQGRPVQFSDFFTGFQSQYLVQLALLSVVSTILVGLGFLLLLIPGVYLAVSYMFAPFFVLDQKKDFWPALEESRKFITPRWFSFFAFSLMLLLVLIGGLLLLGVGLLVAIPVCACTVTAAYNDIFGIKSTF